jgi:predicted nicotinamide N-methyase
MSEPVLPVTPREAIRGYQREIVLVKGEKFRIDRPAQAERLLDDPRVREQLLQREIMPYWTDLWPAARMLAKWMVEQNWPAGLQALEIGCGLGLVGVVALSRGLRVTFSDYDATALEFAARNARINGYKDFDTLVMDWNHPPQGLKVPVLLASDLIYEPRNVAPLVALIKALLAEEGVALVTDPDRIPAALFSETLQREGLPFTTQRLRAGEPGGDRLKGTLYRITQKGGRDPLRHAARPRVEPQENSCQED